MQFIENLIEDAINLELPALCVVVLLIFWTYQIGRGIFKILCWMTDSSASSYGSAEQLAVSKVAFVREVVSWCAEHLGLPPKINRLPHITIRYYRHAKWGGLYFQRTKEIVIYWDSHWNLLTRINTVIHEYQHFLDLRNNKDDQEYAKELKKVGYFENIYEKNARKTASAWEKQCYEAMVKKGVIKK
jgi:hypothetical protein